MSPASFASTRTLVARLCLAACCQASFALSPVSAEPLNVIVVMVDDLGWRDVGCQGSTFYRTPQIDQLAADGMRFTNGYAACAVCSPTRAAYLTGRYPARLGITDWMRGRWQRAGHTVTEADRPPLFQTRSRQQLLCPRNPYWMELAERTLAEELQDAGYATGHVGKWHLGGPAWYPEHQGFVENVGGCDLGHPPSYFDPYARDNPHGPPWQIDHLTPRQEGEYLTDREAEAAEAFIRRHAGQPFFLSLCHYAVHTPIEAKPALTDWYEMHPDPEERQTNARYAAMIQSVDDSLGRIRSTLAELQLAHHTLIVFTSDNGGLVPVTNNWPLRAGKGTPYEGGIRVPWIIDWPGVTEPGTTSSVPIITCDLKPTILAAVGVRATDDQPTDGVSLTTLLESGTPPEHRALFWHFPHYRHGYGPYAIVREGPYKLIRFFENERRELYDLANDLGEQTDLAPTQQAITQQLDDKLTDWLARVGARLPKRNRPLGQGGQAPVE